MRPQSPKKSKAASAALWCSPSPNTTTRHYKLTDVSSLAQQLRQLGDIAGNPPRLIFAEQLCCRSPVLTVFLTKG
jgi:hypothetical protein